jgi:hypothetical protein
MKISRIRREDQIWRKHSWKIWTTIIKRTMTTEMSQMSRWKKQMKIRQSTKETTLNMPTICKCILISC